jgi:threonyl-tRNA synthetase
MVGEIERVLTFCLDILTSFGFKEYKLYLSTKPKEKSVGDVAKWESAQQALEQAIKKVNLPFEIDEGGGAFYGPKIDLKIKDAIGREWQCSTIQFDFNLPERFDMTYIGPDGNKHQPYMIHRALFGSLERFFGILIEHYAGKFPFWLAPVQVKILTISDKVHAYANTVKDKLLEAGIRLEMDFANEKIGAKIRTGINEKVPYLLIIGEKEAAENKVAVRSRDKGDLGAVSVENLLEIMG